MFLRNLMAMDTEEMIRAQPMDSVVLIGGCDKTLPAQMMAAASADLPAIFVPVGPMLVGHHRGETLGACTDCRRLWSDFRGGRIDAAEIDAVNAPPRADRRHLHGDGHGEHDGVHRRDDGAGAADLGERSRRPMPTGCARPRRAASRRRRWPSAAGPRRAR